MTRTHRAWRSRALASGLAALALVAAALAAGQRRAAAHQLQVEPVAAVVRPQADFVTVTFAGNVQDITQSVDVRDDERRGDGFARSAEERVERYFNERFVLRQGDARLQGKLTSLRHQGALDPTQARFTLALRYEKPGGARGPFVITSTLFDYLPNALITLNVAGTQRNLRPGDSTEVDPSAFATNLLRNVLDFLVLGAEHIVTGPDHVLFILALLLVSTSLKGLIKTLTGFTVAHSLTLVLSTLRVVSPPAQLVDVLVALSIVYVGLENVFLKETRHRFWVASAFGLVHGFAFAANLRDAGLPEGSALFWSLLSFNLGVELAQVLLCAAAFPLLVAWRRSTEQRQRYGGMPWPTVVRTVSLGVAAAGGYWLKQHLLG